MQLMYYTSKFCSTYGCEIYQLTQAQGSLQLWQMSSEGGLGGDDVGISVREQDRFLPIANISRIMKKALPSNAKIAKDAKETVQECVSEFISFITSE